MKAGLHCWIWVQRCPNAGFLQGVRAGCAEKRLVSRKEQCLCSVVPGNSYNIWMLWVCVNQGWWRRCGPMWCDCEALCVCMFPQEIFPSYTQQVNYELSKHFSSALHTGSETVRFTPCFLSIMNCPTNFMTCVSVDGHCLSGHVNFIWTMKTGKISHD